MHFVGLAWEQGKMECVPVVVTIEAGTLELAQRKFNESLNELNKQFYIMELAIVIKKTYRQVSKEVFSGHEKIAILDGTL